MGYAMGQAALNRTNAEDMVLLCIHAAGADGRLPSELRRDLYGLVSHHLAPGEWRNVLDGILTSLLDRGDAELVSGKRFGLTRTGSARVAQSCGGKLPKASSWQDLRNSVLVAKALTEVAPHAAAARLRPRKTLASANELRAAILETAFKLKLKQRRSAAEIRRQLAGKAPAIGVRPAATGNPRGDRKAADRARAARLLRSSRPVDSDGALIRQLAAEQVGSLQTDVTALRTALLRRLIVSDRPQKAAKDGKAAKAPARPAAQTPRQGELPLVAAVPVVQSPPGLAEFARIATEAARQRAEGWAGNRRAFVSKVWSGIAASHPQWGLDEAAFKALLVDAHREGLISLTNADVRDRETLPELEASAIQHANSVWHYIRVET